MGTEQKVAIIGVGLLGGSLALALKKKRGVKLMGWNHRASSRRKASRILPVASTIEKAVEGADTILLCSHSSSIPSFLGQLLPIVRNRSLILDVSSVKAAIARETSRIPGASSHFIPCHPMAGKESSGPANADASLYVGRTVFITPLPRNSRKLVQRAVRFWKSIGALPVILKPEEHDRIVALTSHLPHLLASAFMGLYGGSASKVSLRSAVGPGFRDFTRIAAGNPVMWSDIVEMNAREIKTFLSRYRRILASLEKNLKPGRRRAWLSFFGEARTLREKI